MYKIDFSSHYNYLIVDNIKQANAIIAALSECKVATHDWDTNGDRYLHYTEDNMRIEVERVTKIHSVTDHNQLQAIKHEEASNAA